MKLNKKKVLVSALAVSLIAILSFGTIAWFSDADSVTNKFHVAGGENQDPDEIFSIDVMEKVDVDGDGDYDGLDATIGYNSEDGEWNYESITPADVLLKRPSVKNTGSYDQWIRMKVTVSGEFVDILNTYGIYFTDIFYDLESCEIGTNYLGTTRTAFAENTKWDHVKNSTSDCFKNADGTYTYVFYYKNMLGVDESAVLFSIVNIPSQFTENDVATLNAGEFEMNIKAEAIQADNTGSNAREAFARVEAEQEIK